METAKIIKQMIGFQKAMFDNSFSAMSVMQDYSENMMAGCLKQFPWVTEESRKPLDDSMKFFKSTRKDYKKAMDDGYTKWAELVEMKKNTAGKADDAK